MYDKKTAGKPTYYSAAMRRCNVMLPAEAVEFFTAKGNGNMSKGIRDAWADLANLIEIKDVGNADQRID